MVEAITIGILCLLLLIAVVCLLRNRVDGVTPRCSNSIQESGEDDMSENHRMDVFSQERFPIIKEIQNTIQLIYQRCRWKSYRVARISSVSTQTDPCGQPERTFVKRPLATNLSDSLTPQGTQSRHATVVASYREATSQTPNPETSRISEAETDPRRHEAMARQTAEAVTDEGTDPPRHEVMARQTAEAVTDEGTDPPRHEAMARQTAEAVTDVVTNPPRHEAMARQTAEAVTDVVTNPPRHEVTAGQTAEAVTSEVTDPPRHEAMARQTAEAVTDVAANPPRHEVTAGQTAEAVTDEVTDPPRHEAMARQTAEAVTDEVTDPPRHEVTAGQTAEAVTDEVTDPPRHEAMARQTEWAPTMAVTDPERSDMTAVTVTETVKNPSSHHTIKRETTETNAAALNDVTYQKPVSDGQLQNDIDIHQSTRDREDLGDEPQDFMFPEGNKEAGILFKEQDINLKPVSKKGSGDTANYEKSLNKNDNLNLLCDSETSSSRSSNSLELTEEEESPKGYRWTTDQSEIPLSKSETKSKLENCHRNVLASSQQSDIFIDTKLGKTEDGQDLKASQRAHKTQDNMFLEKNTDQGTQRMMSFKEDTSKKYKPSQSKTTPKAENTHTEKELSTLFGYDADNEYSSSDAETENNPELSSYAKLKRPLSTHEEPADGNIEHSSSDRSKNRGKLPYSDVGAFCKGAYKASLEKQNEKTYDLPTDTYDRTLETTDVVADNILAGEFGQGYTTEVEAQEKNPKDINDRQDDKVTLDADEMAHVDNTMGCDAMDITDEAPQTATMDARGEERSQFPEIALTLGHFSNNEPWKSGSKPGSDCHINSIELDREMANGLQIAENGNLQVYGSKYTGAKERIKGGRKGGNSNPEDPGSIQHDNEKASGRDDTKGDCFSERGNQNFNSGGKEKMGGNSQSEEV